MKTPSSSSFPENTAWTELENAQKAGGKVFEAMVNALAARYLPALEAAARSIGLPPSDAADLAAVVAGYVFQVHRIARMDRTKGRFSAYLATVMSNQKASWFRRAYTQKRDESLTVSMEGHENEMPYTEIITGEEIDRAHAIIILQRVRDKMRQGMEETLFTSLWGDMLEDETSRVQRAEQFGMADGAYRQRLLRFKKTFHAHFFSEVANFHLDPTDVLAEMKYLLTLALQAEGPSLCH